MYSANDRAPAQKRSSCLGLAGSFSTFNFLGLPDNGVRYSRAVSSVRVLSGPSFGDDRFTKVSLFEQGAPVPVVVAAAVSPSLALSEANAAARTPSVFS
jgi:hypothetical protein